MNQIYRKSPFWSLAGPMLGYLAIQFAVQFAAQLVIEMPYVMRAYAHRCAIFLLISAKTNSGRTFDKSSEI